MNNILRMLTQKISRVFAWSVLLSVVFVTVSPIDLRPADIFPVDFDRAAAFLVMSALFVFAYPRQIILVAVLLIFSAGVIETLQFLSPTRHAHLSDALVKTFGALIGIFIGWAADEITHGLESRSLVQLPLAPNDVLRRYRERQNDDGQ